eukprot:14218387-Ditylum_brightwellii.AAC.1
MMGSVAVTTTVSLFAKILLVLLEQAPDDTPLVTGNSAAGNETVGYRWFFSWIVPYYLICEDHMMMAR